MDMKEYLREHMGLPEFAMFEFVIAFGKKWNVVGFSYAYNSQEWRYELVKLGAGAITATETNISKVGEE